MTPGDLVCVTMPGSAWLGILTAHISGTLENLEGEFSEADQKATAWQLKCMMRAVELGGLGPDWDDTIQSVRGVLNALLTRLGHCPTQPYSENRIAGLLAIDQVQPNVLETCVFRLEDLRAVFRKVVSTCYEASKRAVDGPRNPPEAPQAS